MNADTTCAIVCNGLIGDYSWLKRCLEDYDYIVAANGGSDHLMKAGVRPGVVIGDLDSSGTVPDDIEIISFPPEKDFTDAELAIRHAIAQGVERIDMYGALGGRIDHALCNMFLLASYPHQLRICDPGTTMECCSAGQSVCIAGKRGDLLSLLPVSKEVRCTGKNLKYPLNGEILKRSGRGISNILDDEKAFIEVHSGDLMIIHIYDEER